MKVACLFLEDMDKSAQNNKKAKKVNAIASESFTIALLTEMVGKDRFFGTGNVGDF